MTDTGAATAPAATAHVLAGVLNQPVLANRMLAREDVIDDFGHVNVRHPLDPGRYFLSRSRSPEIVTRNDLMEFALDGEPVTDAAARSTGSVRCTARFTWPGPT